MFSDPQTITIDGVTKSMPRIKIDTSTQGKVESVYSTADGAFVLTITHQTTRAGRIRSKARLDVRAIVTNPLDSSSDYDTITFEKLMDRPEYGFSMVLCEQVVAGFNAWQTNTVVDRMYGKES